MLDFIYLFLFCNHFLVCFSSHFYYLLPLANLGLAFVEHGGINWVIWNISSLMCFHFKPPCYSPLSFSHGFLDVVILFASRYVLHSPFGFLLDPMIVQE